MLARQANISLVVLISSLTIPSPLRAAEPAADSAAETVFGSVTERHLMIPVRDGKRLSVYVYLPAGKGPWPVIYEQRYADIRTPAMREGFARLAERGYAVVIENFRGTHLSEGTWVGYRALGWGELQDGYDTVEWLAQQPWSTGKVGTFGSSQAGFAQNFLAVAGPPHLTCQYMIDTGLSLFHEGYRIGGTTRPQRFLKLAGRLPQPGGQRSGCWTSGSSTLQLRRLLGPGRLLAAFRQDERPVLHGRELVRLHVRRLDPEFHRAATPGRIAVARPAAAFDRPLAARAIQGHEQDRRTGVSRGCPLRAGSPHGPLVRSLPQREDNVCAGAATRWCATTRWARSANRTPPATCGAPRPIGPSPRLPRPIISSRKANCWRPSRRTPARSLSSPATRSTRPRFRARRFRERRMPAHLRPSPKCAPSRPNRWS